MGKNIEKTDFENGFSMHRLQYIETNTTQIQSIVMSGCLQSGTYTPRYYPSKDDMFVDSFLKGIVKMNPELRRYVLKKKFAIRLFIAQSGSRRSLMKNIASPTPTSLLPTIDHQHVAEILISMSTC